MHSQSLRSHANTLSEHLHDRLPDWLREFEQSEQSTVQFGIVGKCSAYLEMFMHCVVRLLNEGSAAALSRAEQDTAKSKATLGRLVWDVKALHPRAAILKTTEKKVVAEYFNTLDDLVRMRNKLIHRESPLHVTYSLREARVFLEVLTRLLESPVSVALLTTSYPAAEDSSADCR